MGNDGDGIYNKTIDIPLATANRFTGTSATFSLTGISIAERMTANYGWLFITLSLGC